MIDGAKFDEIVKRLRFINNHKKTEREIKLIICGDFLQLPPINSDSGYFFNGGEYTEFENNSYICKLREVKRQNNKEFIELLERVRLGVLTKDDIKYIKLSNIKHKAT